MVHISLLANVPVGEYDPNDGNYSSTSFKTNIIGIGYDFTLSNVLFLEGHPSMVGKGFGYRGFMGLSFENFIYNLGYKIKNENKISILVTLHYLSIF